MLHVVGNLGLAELCSTLDALDARGRPHQPQHHLERARSCGQSAAHAYGDNQQKNPVAIALAMMTKLRPTCSRIEHDIHQIFRNVRDPRVCTDSGGHPKAARRFVDHDRIF